MNRTTKSHEAESLHGLALLNDPAPNKGTAFTEEERLGLKAARRFTAIETRRDELILCARILLAALFVVFGWTKLAGFSGTIDYMAADGTPLPTISAVVAVVMEFFVGLSLMIGFFTRPLALLLAIYTLGAALIGHHFWTLADGERFDSATNFYKNISIMGGLILLSVTGAGKYSLDRE